MLSQKIQDIKTKKIQYTDDMSTKTWLMIGMTIGSTIGGFIPTLWGASWLSYQSLFATAIGGFVGIWICYKLFNDSY
jgi:uncharacterized membrane protein YeaQ/YmgE (transglycosylase-associated protein family)